MGGNRMKKIILTLIILVCFTALLHAKQNDIIVSQNGKAIGSFTVEQFKTLIDGADKYKEIMEAQKDNRVSVQLLNDVEKTTIINQYKAVVKIRWVSKDNKEINYIDAIIFINIDNQNEGDVSECRIVYRNISEIGFPITGGLLIFVLIILF